MNDHSGPTFTRIDPLTRLLIRLAGGDVDTATRCPPRDLEVFRILALIMLGQAAYMTSVLSLIVHRVFVTDGAINPVIILVAALIASFIMLLESLTIMRAGWLKAGKTILTARALISVVDGRIA